MTFKFICLSLKQKIGPNLFRSFLRVNLSNLELTEKPGTDTKMMLDCVHQGDQHARLHQNNWSIEWSNLKKPQQFYQPGSTWKLVPDFSRNMFNKFAYNLQNSTSEFLRIIIGIPLGQEVFLGASGKPTSPTK